MERRNFMKGLFAGLAGLAAIPFAKKAVAASKIAELNEADVTPVVKALSTPSAPVPPAVAAIEPACTATTFGSSLVMPWPVPSGLCFTEIVHPNGDRTLKDMFGNSITYDFKNTVTSYNAHAGYTYTTVVGANEQMAEWNGSKAFIQCCQTVNMANQPKQEPPPTKD